MIKVREVEIVNEVKTIDGLWRLACGDIFVEMSIHFFCERIWELQFKDSKNFRLETLKNVVIALKNYEIYSLSIYKYSYQI